MIVNRRQSIRILTAMASVVVGLICSPKMARAQDPLQAKANPAAYWRIKEDVRTAFVSGLAMPNTSGHTHPENYRIYAKVGVDSLVKMLRSEIASQRKHVDSLDDRETRRQQELQAEVKQGLDSMPARLLQSEITQGVQATLMQRMEAMQNEITKLRSEVETLRNSKGPAGDSPLTRTSP